MKSLQSLLEGSARDSPDRVAAEDPLRGESITYRALNERSDNLRDELTAMGVRPQDRVAIGARKSIAAVISVFGVLKAGAAYVPVAIDAPPDRNANIVSDCSVKTLIADGEMLERLRNGPDNLDVGASRHSAALSTPGNDLALANVSAAGASPETPRGVPDDLAYVLYTSGSTGRPKGVMHSHASALCFVDWCSKTFEPTGDDRFSSHAPFHFDLSIFDIYVAIKHGATLVLINEDAGKLPAHLAALIAEQRISIWYSTPSVLRLLVEYGQLERHDFAELRLVLFAGEVFPHRYLRALLDQWPDRRYFNLYGPTETNVCTCSEVSSRSTLDRSGPATIGKACSGTMTRVVSEAGLQVGTGEEGELWVSGGTVMRGYWNRPELDERAFHRDEEGRRWYRTGDLVKKNDAGDYLFLGRRDRMVKRRGYRIELGEVESLMYRHPLVTEAAVIAYADREENVRIMSFLCWAGEKRPSVVALKQFCGENMPAYFIPDQFAFLESMPKTSTDKIDYQSLLRMQR